MHPSLKVFSFVIPFCTIGLTVHAQSDSVNSTPVIDLEQFIEIALIHNPGVDDARSQIWAAEGRSTQAASGYLPRLSASAQAALVHIDDLTPTDEDSVLSGTLSADQLIFDFGKTTGAISAAGKQVESARAYLNSVGSNLVYSVKASYYDVLSKSYLIQVATEQVNSYTKHHERAVEYYKAGVKSKIDVTNAEVELADANLLLLQSKFGLKSAKVHLEKTIGTKPNNGSYQVSNNNNDLSEFKTLLADIPGTLEDLLQRASLQRPDLIMAEREIEASEALLTSAHGDYWPVIGANGTYNAYETDLATFQNQWQLGVGLTWEFFSGMRTDGEVAEAKSYLRSAQARLHDIMLTATQQVTDSYHLAQEKRESVFLADKIVKLASENLSLADGRYKTGLGDMIEFNDAQLRFSKAKSNLVTTFFDFNKSLASLENAIGQFPNMNLSSEDQLITN